MQFIHQHWQIENRLHYVRDVTFHEDACKIRQPKPQRLLACLNNLVIGLIHKQPLALFLVSDISLPFTQKRLFTYSFSDFAIALKAQVALSAVISRIELCFEGGLHSIVTVEWGTTR